MMWVMDINNDMVNLEQVEAVQIRKMKYPKGDQTHEVAGIVGSADCDYYLFYKGTEEDCKLVFKHAFADLLKPLVIKDFRKEQ